MKNKVPFIFYLVIGCLIFLLGGCTKDDTDPDPYPEFVKDIDGNIYQTVVIGNQVWMAENLRVIHYRNGDPIETTSPASLNYLGEIDPKYQWAYNGNEDNADTYGRLYTWYAINDSRNICPKGWHIPSDEEWKELELQLGMSPEAIDLTDFRGIDEGCQLAGLEHLWNNGALILNESYAATAFAASPAGFHHPDGSFQHLGNYTHWWTSTESNDNHAWYRELCINYTGIKRYYYAKTVGFSVRCIKD